MASDVDTALPENLARPLVVIHVPHTPSSVDFRPHLASIGPCCLLRLLVSRVQTDFGRDLRLLILCHESLHPTVAGGVPVVNVGPVSQFEAFAELARRFPFSDLTFVPLGSVVAPPDLLSRALQFHTSSRLDCTFVAGFPDDSVPMIVRSELIVELAGFRSPDLPVSPRAVIETLMRALAAAGEQLSDNPAIGYFQAARSYGASESQLPERVQIETVAELEQVRRVIVATGDGYTGTERYVLLKRTIVGDRAEALSRARAARISTAARAIDREGPKAILFASAPSAYSGGEEVLCGLVAHLDQSRFRPQALVGVSGLFTRRLRAAGAEVWCPEADFAQPSVSNFLYALNLLSELRPAIIHVNALVGPPLLAASSLLAIPVVRHAHVARLNGIAEELKQADAIIAVSSFVRDRVLRLDISAELVHVVHNGVDTTEFARSAGDRAGARESLGLAQDRRMVLMIGRFVQWKRQDLAVQAFEILRARLPLAQLLLVGDVHGSGRWYSAIADMIQRKGLARDVLILPFQEDIRKVIAASEAMLLCSEDEPFGACVTQAMAMELPVVVSNSGGLPELVSHARTGYIASSFDPQGVAHLLMRALAADEKVTMITKAARKHAVEALSPATMANHGMRIWDDVLEGRS